MINDGYIHWNLLRHMLKAGLIGEAQKLVTDLRWLAAKLDVTGPADLLNDYLSIKGQVDDKVIYNTAPFGGAVTGDYLQTSDTIRWGTIYRRDYL